MKAMRFLVVVLSVSLVFSCVEKPQAKAPAAASSQASGVTMAQADSYFLYSYAVRDAKALIEKTVPDMVVRVNGNVTVYEFIDHVIRECGTHLTGTVTVTDNGDVRAVVADFHKVVKNPYEITSFKFDITEPKDDFHKSTGKAVVNGKEYPIGEIISVSRYY